MFSFAVTAYEEMRAVRLSGQRLANSIDAALAHDAIDEVVIVDDGSSDFGRLENLIDAIDNPKIHLYHNERNLGVFGNKLEAKARCTNEWVITCDSDNAMDSVFIDDVIAQDLRPDTWYCPTFARPDFDYRMLAGTHDLKGMCSLSAQHKIFGCAINTGNQTVHREGFMEVFGRFRGCPRFDLMLPNYLGLPEAERQKELWHTAYGANDSCLYNLLWLQMGNFLRFVPGLEYDHYRATGMESNYNRGPSEKLRLTDHLLGIFRRGTQ
jgi:glycosyltransferase involved in cell wall biosynthesis